MKDYKEFPKPEAWWNHLVSYKETDAMAIVHHSNYLHWFEQARTNFLRERGMYYSEMEKKGVFLPVREAYCRYRAPARFEESISIRTGVDKWTKTSITFCYEVYNLTQGNILMTNGHTQHACIDQQGKIIALPQWLKQLFMP